MAPSAKVLKLIEKLKDLPKEAEQEASTVAELKAEISRLKQELRKVPEPKTVVQRIDETAVYNRFRESFILSTRDWQNKVLTDAGDLRGYVERYLENLKKIQFKPPVFSTHPKSEIKPITKIEIKTISVVPKEKALNNNLKIVDEAEKIGKSERAILGFLLLNPSRAYTKSQIGPMIGMAWKGGSFRTYVSRLRSAGFVTGNDSIQITEMGQRAAASMGIQPPSNVRAGLEGWLDKLSGGCKKIYEVVSSDHSRIWSFEEIAAQASMAYSGGSFRTYVSRLCSLGLVVRKEGGLQLNPEVRNL